MLRIPEQMLLRVPSLNLLGRLSSEAHGATSRKAWRSSRSKLQSNEKSKLLTTSGGLSCSRFRKNPLPHAPHATCARRVFLFPSSPFSPMKYSPRQASARTALRNISEALRTLVFFQPQCRERADSHALVRVPRFQKTVRAGAYPHPLLFAMLYYFI